MYLLNNIMQYDIIVQNKLFETITAENGYSFNFVANKVMQSIKDGQLDVDSEQPLDIRVIPRNT